MEEGNSENISIFARFVLGLSSSPDSFKDAAIPISPALSDANESKQEELDQNNDSAMDTDNDSDAEEVHKSKFL